jgi:hypothetical protein
MVTIGGTKRLAIAKKVILNACEFMSSCSPCLELHYSIQSGDIPKAFDLLKQHFPVLISPADASSRKVLFRLNCQRFIEIVRLGETLEALKFAQTTLRALSNDLSINGTPEEIETLSTISSLIAYQNPDQSPIAKYLDQSYRDNTADIVNNAVLGMSS